MKLMDGLYGLWQKTAEAMDLGLRCASLNETGGFHPAASVTDIFGHRHKPKSSNVLEYNKNTPEPRWTPRVIQGGRQPGASNGSNSPRNG